MYKPLITGTLSHLNTIHKVDFIYIKFFTKQLSEIKSSCNIRCDMRQKLTFATVSADADRILYCFDN